MPEYLAKYRLIPSRTPIIEGEVSYFCLHAENDSLAVNLAREKMLFLKIEMT